ncbi:LamG domain-containing protein [Flavobacterium agrisoli]|uniref:LamG domain-containing protein n=1 Tax=Flavobacterium agrisoli TaxID=2793066 RepID=A0A934PM89_9FLAO|nr:LamG domain-containing protein [Flavobacterium agrisoli]MBK0368968.1 LamG domain-containing protein [Flavobacterium agrisoli]
MKKLLCTLLVVHLTTINGQNPIQEFNFNGSLLNTVGEITFMGTPTYVADRFAIPNKAIRLAQSDLEAVIKNLPQNNEPRTVSIWVKFNDVSDANYVWGYGTAYNAQYFGLIHQAVFNSNSNLSLAGWGPTNDLITNTDLSTKNWFNYVVTYDGSTSSIYRNGELLKSAVTPTRYTKGDVFKLGKINAAIGINADIDDLKIYNIALTQQEVASLYLNEKPSVLVAQTPTVKTKTTVKKTTSQTQSKTVITATELISTTPKEIEIFSQGQKVLGSSKKAVNISELPAGTYLLKISDATSKTVTAN